MDVELRPGADFHKVVARLRGAPPKIRKALNQEIKSATAPIERDMKQNVKGIESRGVRGGGSGQRSAARKGKTRGTGLRDSIAKGVTRKITYNGFRTGVRVRVDGKHLPENQRSLIKATNKGEVRHPVFGNRSVWTPQQFTPAGWFDRAVAKNGPAAVRKIEAAARKALKELEK
jgi:hypothetical protein